MPTVQGDNSKKSQPLAATSKMPTKQKKINHNFICCLSLSTWFSDTYFLARETRAAARRPLTSSRAVQFRDVSNDDSELWFAIVCLPGDSTKVFHQYTYVCTYSRSVCGHLIAVNFCLSSCCSCLNQYTFLLILFYLYWYVRVLRVHHRTIFWELIR